MNCQVVHACFEDPLRLDFDLRAASAEVAEHLVSCGDCRRFVESQRRLGAGLRLAQASTPSLPAWLDAAVLNNYRRREWAPPSSLVKSGFPSGRRFALWSWGAVGAALALVAVILLVPRKSAVPMVEKTQPGQPLASSQKAAGGAEHVTSRAIDAGPAAAPLRPAPAEIAHQHTIAPGAGTPEALPASFRGLMYCDALSCGGTMEVIRVQLPASAVALAPSSASSGDAVFADVLVGPDGIARGIRIVE